MNDRIQDGLLLLAVTACLTLPRLGSHALWDMDEGVNAGCAREMHEADTWIVPTFNWELRSAKPVLLYWLQRFSFSALGVDEFSARLPSVLLGMMTVLALYELGRQMFDRATGFWGGVILASTIQFNLLSHAATPDAPLIAFLVLTFLALWLGHSSGGRGWLIAPAIPCGLAILAKGPVGLGLPALAIVAYFLWNREGKRLLDHRLLYGVGLLAVVVVPWVAFVTAESRGEWLLKFLKNENLNRIAVPQENHRGPVVYYLIAMVVLSTPWSCVIGGTIWQAVRASRRTESRTEPRTQELSVETRATRFLLTWILATLIPFSFFATKLPNYIGPLYPPLALLTARFFVLHARGVVRYPRWFWGAAQAGLVLTGLSFLLGLIAASGRVPLDLPGLRTFPGLENWAWVGLFPLGAAGVVGYAVSREKLRWILPSFAIAAIGLIGPIAGGAVLVIDAYKAAKPLTLESGACQPDREIRVATWGYYSDSQSIVFYAQRRIEVLPDAAAAEQFLRLPLPVYVYMPKSYWDEQLAGRPGLPGVVVAQRYDFIKNKIIVVAHNQQP